MTLPRIPSNHHPTLRIARVRFALLGAENLAADFRTGRSRFRLDCLTAAIEPVG